MSSVIVFLQNVYTKHFIHHLWFAFLFSRFFDLTDLIPEQKETADSLQNIEFNIFRCSLIPQANQNVMKQIKVSVVLLRSINSHHALQVLIRIYHIIFTLWKHNENIVLIWFPKLIRKTCQEFIFLHQPHHLYFLHC